MCITDCYCGLLTVCRLRCSVCLPGQPYNLTCKYGTNEQMAELNKA